MEDVANLRARAQAGDANACARLGWRLILGDGVAPSPPEGLPLLLQALQLNDSEAAYLLSRMAAWGVYRRRNKAEALQLLRRAATGGFQTAKEELALLEGPALGRVSARPVMFSQEPCVRVIEKFASPEECDWLIARCRDGLARAKVYYRGAETRALDLRTNTEADLTLSRVDVLSALVRERMADAIGVSPDYFEVAKVLHYAPGQEFSAHHDFFDATFDGLRDEIAQRGQRIVTFLVYLNDDYQGGETRFPKAGKSFKGRKGDALFFANVDGAGEPDRQSLHAGAPPTSGEKWVLSQWVRDRPVNAFQALPPFDALDPSWRAKL